MAIITPSIVLNESFMPKYNSAAAGGADIQNGENVYYGFGRSHLFNSAVGSVADGYRITLGSMASATGSVTGGALYLKNSLGVFTVLASTDLIQFRGNSSGIFINGVKATAAQSVDGQIYWGGAGLGTDVQIMNIQAIGKDDAFNVSFDTSRPIGEGGTGTDGYSAPLALTVDILVVNGAPTLTVTGLNPTFTEGAGAAQGAAVAAFSNATVGVLEGAQKVIGLTFVVAGTALNANDLITFDGTTVNLSGNSAGVTATNGMSYAVTITGGNSASIALTSGAGVAGAAVQTLVNAITYQNAVVEDPVAANRTFAISQIKDDGGVLVGGVDTTNLSGLTSVVAIQNVNDAPVIAVPGAQLLGGATKTFDAAGSNLITISDVDTSPAANITVVVSTIGPEGTLGLDPDGAATANGGLAVVSGTSTITLVGTIADINSSLDGLVYTTPGGFDGSATLTVDATDSNGTTLAIQKTVIIGVTPAVTSVNFTNGSFKAGADLTFTAVFSAAVDVTGFPTIAIDVGGNARTATYVSGTGGTSLVFKYTVQAGETDSDGVTVPAGSISLSGGTIFRASTATPAVLTLAGIDPSTGVIVDTTQPTVSITLSDSALKIGDTSLVTITFNEAVTGFDNSDLGTIDAGTLSTVSTSDGGVTWTATLTPTATLEDATNVITLTSAGVTDIAGNTVTGSNTSANYAVDTLRPTATITVSNTALNSVATSLVTIAFNEAVTGFTNADLTIESGTLSTVTTSDGGVTWTATLTPQALVTDATNVITLDNTGVADQAGNAGTGSTTSNNYAVSTNTPSATITLSDSSLIVGETSLVTIAFNEAVTGFDNTDLGLIPAGALSTVSTSDGGTTWTAILTPATPLTDLTNVITLDNTLINSVSTGNAGVGSSTSANYVVDTVPPTVSITLSDSSLIIGETSLVTITFSEAVTGFDNTDLGTIEAGSLSTVSTSDGGITWTATLTPTTPLQDATNVITLTSAGVQDLRGNTVTGSNTSANYAVDTVRPAAVSITVTDTSLIGTETSLVTIVFSEAVTAFSNADLIIDNGTLSAVSSSDGGTTWTATLTPNVGVEDPSNAISVNNTTLTDLAGNAGLGSLNSNNYAIDNLGPTVVSVTVADTLLTIGETSLVTIVFSEAVTDFAVGDFSGPSFAEDVVVSGLSSLDGITWTATLTPDAGVDYQGPGFDLVEVNATNVSDLAGNVGTGAVDSNTYDVDTTRPTATVTLSDSTLTTGDTSLVTITFSEAVTAFTNADLTIDGTSGSLSTVSTSDSGVTWTAILTPTALTTDLTNVITLNNATVTDLQGNAGTSTTDSLNYIVSTAGPSATITLADSTLIVGETSLVTITFSEAVTGFDNTDLTVDLTSGTLSTVSTSDAGLTWTAILTPVTPITDLTNVITLDQTAVTSIATANAGVGTASSANYVVDTVQPTVSITLADSTLIIGETSLVTITFSEAVTGFDNTDLGTIEAGSLSTVTTGDGGVTWTATLTPTTPLTDLTNVITLNSAGVQDLRGNTVTGSNTSANYVVDTVAPTVSITLSDSSLIGGDASLVTITFSEAVTGFDNGDLTIESGTLDTVTTSDGGITWTATLTPAAATEDATNVITLTNAGVQDLRGNNVTGSNTSANYTVDTVAPTVVSFTVADTLLTVGETSLVTLVFSEAVTSFSNSDINFVDYGALSTFSSSDGITWTATLTPDPNTPYITAGVIDLDTTTLTDLAGNPGALVSVQSDNSYDVDTERPTATITLSDSALKIGETSLVTITFNEAVTGFTNADLGTIEAGSLSTVTTSDNITWTATLTPTTPLEDATNVITLTNSGVSDEQGNAGTGTSTSANYAVDTIAPAPLFNLSSYNPTTDTLVLYGQNIDTIAAVGASVLGVLDLTKIDWDIDNNTSLGDFDFNGIGNVASAVVTDANTLTVTLSGAAATALEALMGYGTSGGADSLRIVDGFTRDTVGNLDTTSGDTTPLNILGRFNDGSATDTGQYSFNFATDTSVVDVYVGEDVAAAAGSVNFASGNIVLSGATAAQVVVGIAANTTLTLGATVVTLLGFDSAVTALNNTRVTFSDGSQLLTNTSGASSKLSAALTGTTNDQLIAGGFGDTLQGFAGDDLLIGGIGSDSLYGGIGADTLWGKGGNDYLVGGNGADKFQYTRLNTGDDGHDIIAGFKGGAGGDRLYFTDITTAAAQMISFTQVGSEVLLFNGTESIRITGITGTFSTANLLGNT